MIQLFFIPKKKIQKWRTIFLSAVDDEIHDSVGTDFSGLGSENGDSDFAVIDEMEKYNIMYALNFA